MENINEEVNEVLLRSIIKLAQEDLNKLNKEQANYLLSCRHYTFESTGSSVEYCFTLRQWRNIDALR